MPLGAGDGGEIGPDADVEGDEVIGEGIAAIEVDQTAGAIKPGGGGLDATDAGPIGEAGKVDMDIVVAIETRDVAGQHARIGR